MLNILDILITKADMHFYSHCLTAWLWYWSRTYEFALTWDPARRACDAQDCQSDANEEGRRTAGTKSKGSRPSHGEKLTRSFSWGFHAKSVLNWTKSTLQSKYSCSVGLFQGQHWQHGQHDPCRKSTTNPESSPTHQRRAYHLHVLHAAPLQLPQRSVLTRQAEVLVPHVGIRANYAGPGALHQNCCEIQRCCGGVTGMKLRSDAYVPIPA